MQAKEWLYMETQHFNIIYHPEIQDQALLVAQVAEEVFPDLSEFTGFTPYRKIAIIVSGYDDIANGWAQPKDVAKVWINPLYISTRVDREWLKNVVTHELTHVVQMEATFGLTYKTHKATGASSIFGLPPNSYYPGWYLEGIAQYGSTRQGYDNLDRKRLMVMEQKIQDDQFYTNAELYWMRSPLSGEAFYNFGFGFVDYLMRTYGEKKFLQLQEVHNNFYLIGQQNNIRMVYGKTLGELIDEWKAELKKRFPIRKDRQIAKRVTEKPNLSEWAQPHLTNNNGLIFLEKNINRVAQKIQLWTPQEGLKTILEDPNLTFSYISLSKDHQRLLYTRYKTDQQHLISDLYELNLATGKTRALTHNERIMIGVHFKNSYLIVKNDWGKPHLYSLQDDHLTKLTDTDYNFNITDLKVSPDEKRVAINFNYNGQRGIGILNTTTWKYEKVYYSPENQDWILGDFVDAQHLTFSWDRLEHYDLYQLNIKNGLTQKITNTQEDVLYGQVQGSTWYGQIYGAEGFTLASGSLSFGETIRLQAKAADFSDAPQITLHLLKEGVYNHYKQLRKDLLIPYVDTTSLGITQLWSDPLMELQILYEIKMDMSDTLNFPTLNLQAVWLGSQPHVSLKINADETQIGAEFAQLFNLHPWYVNLSESVDYIEKLKFDEFQLELARVWESKYPGQTMIQTSYSPENDKRTAGYGIQLHHSQNASIGYHGDRLSSTTIVGMTGGSNWVAWGKDSNLFWVEPEEKLASSLLVEKIKYQHNLIDLSNNFGDIYQTGRLYLNFMGDIGIFSDGEGLHLANMVGAELELEGKLLHLLPANMTVTGVINSDGKWKVDYNFATPF